MSDNEQYLPEAFVPLVGSSPIEEAVSDALSNLENVVNEYTKSAVDKVDGRVAAALAEHFSAKALNISLDPNGQYPLTGIYYFLLPDDQTIECQFDLADLLHDAIEYHVSMGLSDLDKLTVTAMTLRQHAAEIDAVVERITQRRDEEKAETVRKKTV